MTDKDKELLAMCDAVTREHVWSTPQSLVATELKRRIEQQSEREEALLSACRWLRDNPDSPKSARNHVIRALTTYEEDVNRSGDASAWTGAEGWSWADIRNNGAVTAPGMNPHNEAQDKRAAKAAPLDRLVMRIRLAIVRSVCRVFLPRNVWVGMHLGAYTQKWSVHLGRIDNRGVLQGFSDREAELFPLQAPFRVW